MLIKCPECELQISDKAVSCPHCGYPLKPNIIRERQSAKRKRLPNGFGQISKIKGKNLRKPFRAMISVGKNPETGRPIVKPLQPESYFATYHDAYTALLEYNRNPEDAKEIVKKTMNEVYEEWSDRYYKNLSISKIKTYTTCWRKCDSLYNEHIANIKIRHIRDFLDTLPNNSMKEDVKVVLNLMFDYAVEREYTDRNYARETKYKFTDEETVRNNHRAFTEEEMKKLWDNVDQYPYIDMILIQCYTGFRPKELISIKLENVNLEEGYIIGGSKTEAGKNRMVPIHEKIKGLVEMKYKVAKHLGSDHLFNKPFTTDPTNVARMHINYDRYYYMFESSMNDLNIIDHKPHDPRKTFVTLAKKYNVNEYALKRIVGHTIGDLTEEVYTERNLDWLKEEINKIV